MAQKKLKRSAQHPVLPPPKQKKCGNCGRKGHNLRGCPMQPDKLESVSERRARIKAILGRTAAARVDLDARAAGADLKSLDAHAAVVYPLGKPKPPGMRRAGIAISRDDIDHHAPDRTPQRPPIAPPVPFDQRAIPAAPDEPPRHEYRCSVCEKPGHTKRNCPDLPAAIKLPPIIEPLKPKNQRCLECGRKGHNSRTCPDLVSSSSPTP